MWGWENNILLELHTGGRGFMIWFIGVEIESCPQVAPPSISHEEQKIQPDFVKSSTEDKVQEFGAIGLV